jgi:dolichyl-phosphooligosaccharide-protein glycotransferase
MENNNKNIKESDDELNIDFSKVTDFFKSLKSKISKTYNAAAWKKTDKVKELEKETKEIKEDVKTGIKALEEKEEKIDDISKDLIQDEQKAKEADELEEDLEEKEEMIKRIKKETMIEEDKDEEVSIDFSKIKGFFQKSRKNKTEKDEIKDSEDEININFKESINATLTFIKKYHVIFLLLIPICLSIFFRAYPIYLPITDEWAENSVYNNIRSNVQGQINQQYPNLPDANKNILIESEIKKILEAQEDDINKQIQGTSDYFKSKMQDDSGQTYLLAIDPYLWYGEIKASLESGFFGNTIKDGKKWYDIRNGRFGKNAEETYTFNLYVGKYLYKAMHFFNKNVSLMQAFFLVPLIIITLSVIPAFFIGKKIGGNVAGLFAGIIVAINSALLGRTPAGFSDTDPYNIFFPLFIAWMFIEAIESNTTRKRIIFSSLAGILIGIYSKAWSGWWYPMMFVLSSLGISCIYYMIKNYKKIKEGLIKYLSIKEIKNTLIMGCCFFVFSLLSITLLRSFVDFTNAFLKGPMGVISLKSVAVKTLWPNVLTTVAEFNVAPLESIMSQMGGKFFFFIAIIGIILTLIIKNKEGKRDIMYASFLTIWFIGTTYAFTKGVRFSILMVPAFAIAFGITLGLIYRYSTEWLSKSIHINKYLSKTLIILIFLLLFVSPLKAANNVAKNEIPSMTDAWYESLIEIQHDSEDAIITSWWDFGHWFAAIAERKVTFDGADQGKTIHYVGKSLLVDEKESAAILKMLNCGQNQGPFLLEKYLNNTPRAIDIINEIMFYDKTQAIKRLEQENLSDEQIENLTKLTHCDDLIPQYYITSEDMIGKAGVWGHFGSWDFDRAKMWQSVRRKSFPNGTDFLKKNYNMGGEEADKVYYEIQSTEADRWVSPWPGYMGGPYSSTIKDDLVTCSNGIQINLTDYNALIPTQQGLVTPTSLVYATKQGLVEKKFKDSPIAVSLALIPEGKGYECLLMDPLLATSTFTRLFFFDGHGSRYFEKFSDKTTFTGQRIIVWKVNWEPNQPIIIDEMQEKTFVKKGDTVSVNYIGWTEEDGIFDSSILNWRSLDITPQTDFEVDYDYTPLDFEAGANQMISGFDNGVIGMNIDSVKMIEIPPEEAYGIDPNAHPLGNKTLFFKIKVTDIS